MKSNITVNLFFPTVQLNGEKIAYYTKGIIENGHHYCIQCSNEDHDYFSTYYSSYLKRMITVDVYSIRKDR